MFVEILNHLGTEKLSPLTSSDRWEHDFVYPSTTTQRFLQSRQPSKKADHLGIWASERIWGCHEVSEKSRATNNPTIIERALDFILT